MRNGEIVDLANERRLSASLEFTRGGAELLVLNGGSRAEEITVLAEFDGFEATRTRSVYCIDSGTSLQVRIPLAAARSWTGLKISILGGHGEMLLFNPKGRHARPVARRVLASAATVLALLMVAVSRLDAPMLAASADPEPAPIEAPLVKSSVSLLVPARLPKVVVARRSVIDRPPATLSVPRAVKVAERRVALAPAANLPKRIVSRRNSPLPMMTDLHVPSTAKSGDFVPVRFGAVGRQVKIVASIGPTIVSKTIIAAQHGVIAIRSPKSDLDSRVMTVRAYAQDGTRSSTLQAMVVLVHP